MHEMSIAGSIIEIATAEALHAGDKKIVRITVDIGALAGVEPEALSFCYEACANGSMAEGSALMINHIAALAHCPTCKKDFTPSSQFFVCPACAGPCGILAGEELMVREVETE